LVSSEFLPRRGVFDGGRAYEEDSVQAINDSNLVVTTLRLSTETVEKIREIAARETIRTKKRVVPSHFMRRAIENTARSWREADVVN
jgi:hypothetical protein